MEVQPQLVLLQKTLLNIEGLGRELDPELDLWKTAKPYLERWMNEQVGWRRAIQEFKKEGPHWAYLLPQLPRLASRYLEESGKRRDQDLMLQQLVEDQRRLSRWVYLLLGALSGLAAAEILAWITRY
jgi:ubiquinone biosynthesis protein